MRRELGSTVAKLLKYFFYAYVAFSIVYAAQQLIFSRREDSSLAKSNIQGRSTASGLAPVKQKVIWTDAAGVSQSMKEEFILSKVFSDAMGPSKVIPYFYKARKVPEQEDVTLCTLVTENRFPVLSRLATNWKGPISVAIHVQDNENRTKILDSLYAMVQNNPDVQDWVDVHLIMDKFERQFNMWRNVGKFFARSEYIMMLDVDFHICTDFRKSIKKDPKIMEMLRTGTAALVVPAFEYNEQRDGVDFRTFPTNKRDLLAIARADKIDMFHKKWVRGHGSTNYTRWYRASEEYKVIDYNYSYEPYIIYKRDATPWCDERFIGYGANKAACLYEIYLSGIDYWVLPDDFLIHQSHYYPEHERNQERRYNKKLYDNYREEVCLRYSRIYVSTGLWNTPRANNVKLECSKIRGFRQAVKTLGTP